MFLRFITIIFISLLTVSSVIQHFEIFQLKKEVSDNNTSIETLNSKTNFLLNIEQICW